MKSCKKESGVDIVTSPRQSNALYLSLCKPDDDSDKEKRDKSEGNGMKKRGNQITDQRKENQSIVE